MISKHYILSAAHCFKPKRVPRLADVNKIVVFLGKYDLNANERFSYPAYPTDIILHDDWNPNDPVYDADIALLYMRDPIVFRSNVYAACFFTNSSQNDGNNAIMVGYGTSEGQNITQHQTVPREAPIRFVSKDECNQNVELKQLTSLRTICGGGRGQASPCRGDSGSGVYIKQNDRWYIRAIVSSSLVKNDKSCDRDNYAIFTDVTKFKTWIYKTIGLSKRLTCEFTESENHYTCKAKELKIDSANTLISGVNRVNHLSDRKDHDVTELIIERKNTNFLPIEISTFFPDLHSYRVTLSGLREIERANFNGLRKLTELNLGSNEIKILPSDVFYDLKRLKKLYLFRNKIKVLNRDLFIDNPILEIIFIYRNEIETLENGLFRGNPMLSELHIDHNKINKIGFQFFDPIPHLHIANFMNNSCVNTHYPKSLSYQNLKSFIQGNCK